MSDRDNRAMPTDELAAVGEHIAELQQLLAQQREETAALRIFKTIVEASNEAIAISDPAGRLLYINPAHARLFGKTLEQARQANYRDYYPDESIEILNREVAPALERGESWEGELVAFDAAGRRFPLWERADAVRDEHGQLQFAFGVMHDISDRKRYEAERNELEAQLRHAQKLEAVGQLASGIAHDFGNLLTTIFGYVDLARRTLPEDHAAIRSLDKLTDAAEHAVGVTRALLTFSRKTPAEKTPVDLTTVVDKAVQLLRRLLPDSIELEVTTPQHAHAPVVNADAAQLQQVIMNLAINARDAMPAGGRLRMETRAYVSPEDHAEGQRPPLPPPCVQVIVQDTGTGIEPGLHERIFEPFFTAKPHSDGTGLGLSVAHGIVTEHGGTITVKSQPTAGATFTVTLPRISAKVTKQTSAPTRDIQPGQGELILLAEDDEHVRRLLVSALRSMKYEIVAVADGEQLQTAVSQQRDRIRLLLTDHEMPRRRGLDCLREFRAAGMDTPAILITATPAPALEDEVDEHTVLLKKPFQISALGELVARLLGPDAPPGGPRLDEQ